jgi:Fe-S-cluster-containing dehydrogenase component
VTQNLVPACVQTCIGRSRVFGDINDPNSEVSYLIAKNPTQVLRPEQGTKPHVFYSGADRNQTEIGREGYKKIEVMEQERSAFKLHFNI